jgi:hypothetical protein
MCLIVTHSAGNTIIESLPADDLACDFYNRVIDAFGLSRESQRAFEIQLRFQGRMIKNNSEKLESLDIRSGSTIQCVSGLLGGMMSSQSDELRIQIDLEHGRDTMRDENAELKSMLARMVPKEELSKCEADKNRLEAELRSCQERLRATAQMERPPSPRNEAARREIEIERAKAEFESTNATLKMQLDKAIGEARAHKIEYERLHATSSSEISSLKKQVQDIHWQTKAAVEATIKSEGVAVRKEHVEKQAAPAAPVPAAQLAQVSRLASASSPSTSELTDEYLQRVLELLKQRRESEYADSKDLETAKKQEETFKKMGVVWTARLKPDDALRTRGEKTVHFDARVDDDEVLLRLFGELDGDKSGSISLSELLESELLSKPENKEMARILRKALKCNLEVFQETLDFLAIEEFGDFKRGTKQESIAAVYDAAVNDTVHPPPQPGTDAWRDRSVTDVGIQPLLERLRNSESSRLLGALEDLASGLTRPDPSGELTFLTLKNAVRKLPRVSGQRMEWARSLGLDGALARHLPPGSLDDGLEGLKCRMDDAAIESALDAFCRDARQLFKSSIQVMNEVKGSTSAIEANSKFEGFTGNFATLDDYHQGAEETMKLGYPNPDLDKGILTDHIGHPSVRRIFVTPNYHIATCLLLEYWWAVDPYFREPLNDPFSSNARRDARILLKQLRVERGIPSDGEKGCDDTIFPGEDGDIFSETLIIFSVSGRTFSPNTAGTKIRELASMVNCNATKDVLQTDEDKVRGIKSLADFECREWQAKNSNIMNPTGSSTSAFPAGATELVGVVLPFTRNRAEPTIKILQEILETMLTQMQGSTVKVDVLTVACKTFEFCRRTSIEVFRKQLEDMSFTDLKYIATKDFNIAEVIIKENNRQSLCNVLVETFVREELKPTFKFALESATDLDVAKLSSVCSAWGVQIGPQATREELIALAAGALNTSAQWKDVSTWVGLYHGRIQGRSKLSLKELMEAKKEQVHRYKMQPGEVLAAFLYTGPNFVPYNSIYRSFPPHMVKLLEGDSNTPRNTMSTTLFCISSALVKLGRHTELPESRKVFRGLGSMLLPQQFWVEHGIPAWKGGVERAIMSTTSDKDVALYYTGGKGMVVEISVGRIQIGGDVGWLSMVRIQMLH